MVMINTNLQLLMRSSDVVWSSLTNSEWGEKMQQVKVLLHRSSKFEVCTVHFDLLVDYISQPCHLAVTVIQAVRFRVHLKVY